MYSRRTFIDQLRACSTSFKLKVESFSSSSVNMLDLCLSKGRRFEKSGFIDVSMHTKPSVIGVPLASRSWHLPSIHKNWPESRVIHYKRVCSDSAGFRFAVFELFKKIWSHDPSHPALESLASSLLSGKHAVNGTALMKKKKVVECSRIVIPFHPGLMSLDVVLQTLDKEFVEHGWSSLVPRIAWSLGAKNVLQRVKFDTKKKLNLQVRAV